MKFKRKTNGIKNKVNVLNFTEEKTINFIIIIKIGFIKEKSNFYKLKY